MASDSSQRLNKSLQPMTHYQQRRGLNLTDPTLSNQLSASGQVGVVVYGGKI